MREGGLDRDVTNNVINVVAGIVSLGEADLGNDFVERVSTAVPHVCTCNQCSTTQRNMSTSEINRDSVNITWNRPQGAVSGFIIYQNNTRIAIVGPGARGYTVNGLNPNTKYHFRIEVFSAYHIYEFGNIIVETKEKDDYGWLPAIYNILL